MSSLPPPGSIPPPPPYGGPPGIPPPAAGPRGCWRVGLIGCGIVGLVVLLVIVCSFLYLRKNPETITDFVMSQVDSHYASDVTEQDKADLHAAYAAYRDRLKQGKASAEPLQRMRGMFVGGGSNNQITREQVHELTAAFREAASASTGPSATAVPITPPADASSTPPPRLAATPVP